MDYKIHKDNAELFETYMVPAWFGPCAKALVALAAPRPGERVLDLACGTGVAAREVAAVLDGGASVSGCDLNQAMLDVAADVAAREGHQIEFRRGDAGNLPFEDGAFDLVLCQQGFQFFPDQQAALSEIRRVLTPSGRFAGAIWLSEADCPAQGAIIQAGEKHGFDAEGSQRPFSFGDAAQVRAVFGGEVFPRLELSSARLMASFDSPKRCIELLASSSLNTRMVLEQATPELRKAIIDDATAALMDYVAGVGVEIPMETHLLLAYM